MTNARAAAGWIACAAAALASGLTVWYLARLPPADLVTYFADDAFYFLVLGRNLAETGRLTFDGVNSATGFHPAWLAVTAALSWAGFEGMGLIRATIAAGYAFHVIAACLIAFIVRDIGSPKHAAWVGALWLANPLSLRLVVGGMEAAIFTAALALACLALVRALTGPAFGLRQAALVSASFALLCLARTDAAVTVACGGAIVAIVLWRRGASWRRIAAVTSILAAGPLLALGANTLWLMLESGHRTQGSAEMKMLWGARATLADRFAFAYHVFGRLSFGRLGASMLGLPTLLSGIGAAVCLVALCLAAAARWKRGETAAPAIAAWLLGSATVATAAVALVLVDYASWYVPLPAFALFASLAIESARRAGPRAFAIACAVLLAAMVWQDARMAGRSTGEYSYARAIYLSVPIFDRLVPPGEPIGAFDAGLREFFASHRIINLDGLVNDAVRPHWAAGTLDEYLAHEGIRFVADDAGNLARARRFSRWPAMREISCVPAGAPFADRCLWQLID